MGKHGITCNVIRPITAWRGAKGKIEEFEVNRPEDVAVFVIYLASESADYINGCVFEVYNGHFRIFEELPPVKQVLWKAGQVSNLRHPD